MEQKLIEAYESLLTNLTTIQDFVIEETPIVLQQVLAWEFAVNLIWFIIGLVLLITVIVVIVTLMKQAIKENNDEAPLIILILGIFVGIFPLIIVISTIDWLKILIAPKIFLIEYLSNLITG